MNEINAAYDQIKNPQQNTGYGGAYQQQYQQYGYGGFGRYAEAEEEPTGIRAAENYIRVGYFTQALNALESVDARDRNARWYYLSAYASFQLGNRIRAQEHARRAVQLEPNNYNYVQLLQAIENGSNMYRNMGQGYTVHTGGLNPLCLSTLFCLFCNRFPWCCWC
jgi:molecular chaperone DnaJ